MNGNTIERISKAVAACTRCPELRAYCADIAHERRRAYRDESYWGRPVPAFGDADARVLIVGLAPGAHGSNRTGRMFTGDASGLWLYRALHRAGFANQAEARARGDGLVLRGALISAALRCAPPANKPTVEQLERCAPYLEAELAALNRLAVVVALGSIGMRAAVKALKANGFGFSSTPRFAHGAETTAIGARGRITLLASYHPSRQNTNTGVLTEGMLDAVFSRAFHLSGGRPA